MTAPTPESVELAKKRLAQAKARLDALNARIATEGRRLDTRRKIILGGLLLDAATKDQRFAGIVSELTHRISRDQDRKPFEGRSEEHTSELQSLMRSSYAVFCLKKKKHTKHKARNKKKKHASRVHRTQTLRAR